MKKKIMSNKLVNMIMPFVRRVSADNVPAFSAQASFFLFISIFPTIIILISLVKYTPLTQEMMLAFVYDYVPDTIGVTLNAWIREIYHSSPGIVSMSVIFAIWATSRGFIALCSSIEKIYRIESKKNYVIKRLFAILYTFVFILMLQLAANLLIFGDKLMVYIGSRGGLAARIASVVSEFRIAAVIIVFFLFFLILYRFVPYSKSSFKSAFPGALFTTVGWLLFSIGYGIYVNHVNVRTSIYGSLQTIVLLMLWLYFCMYILLLGAEINVYIADKE